MSKVLIIGASGLVGHYLFREFRLDRSCDLLGTCQSRREDPLISLDIRDPGAVTHLCRSFAPETILLPAANPNVDECELNPLESGKINVDGTRNVAAAAKTCGAKLVFFSTDYVFDGTSGPYTEEDPPRPISEYGRQKLNAEKIVRETDEHHIIARIAVVYGWEKRGKNFVVRLISSLQRGESIRVVHDQISNPTYAPDIARTIKRLVASDARGTFHTVGNETMDRASFARIVCRVFDLDERLLVPVATAELRQPAARPLRGGLSTDKLAATAGLNMIGPLAGLTAMRSEGRYRPKSDDTMV